MEKFISKPLLTTIRNTSLSESLKYFAEAKSKHERKSLASEVSVFLSHKHGETDIIEQAITLLSRLGVSVYVDWQDYGIPPSTDGSTASRIKKKIAESDKFILLATESAIASKWCNWELGIGDALKYPKNIAIMPVTDKEEADFSGTEYLQTYPLITSEYSYIEGALYVEYQGNKMKLKDWLSRK